MDVSIGLKHKTKPIQLATVAWTMLIRQGEHPTFLNGSKSTSCQSDTLSGFRGLEFYSLS